MVTSAYNKGRWHADIKPDNILSVQGGFKLSDPGFASFVQKADDMPKRSIQGGTETYGMSILPLVSCLASPSLGGR
jgi:serine/threonine protein kinase